MSPTTGSDQPAQRFDLRVERLNRGYSISQLAKVAGVARVSIRRLEAGGSCHPMSAKAIADVFGVKATDVLPAAQSDVAA